MTGMAETLVRHATATRPQPFVPTNHQLHSIPSPSNVVVVVVIVAVPLRYI